MTETWDFKSHADLPLYKITIYIYCASQDKGGVFLLIYEGWNFNSGNYLFTTDTK